jgi:glycerol-3-phosphate dehydrogenase
MQRNSERFRQSRFDVLVIGGGITGACLAHDCALRGLSVALVERRDFAGATSSASSKLLHGGIRYLQSLAFRKVRESAYEAAAFQRIAPHLTRWVPFLVPTRRSLGSGQLVLRSGMALYEAVAMGAERLVADPAKRAPRTAFLSRSETLSRVPILEGTRDLTGAQVLYESHLHDSERTVLAFLKSASGNGAVVGNYLEVTTFLHDRQRIAGARARDELTGESLEIHARIVANAAGPWIPELNASLPGVQLHRRVTHFSRGSHIVTRPLEGTYALALATSRPAATVIDRGGRHVFVIPWRGHSLIGTSDAPFSGRPDEVAPTSSDIAALLDDINTALPSARLRPADVSYAYAGLYPLTSDEVRPDVYQGTGQYQVVDHARSGGIEGLVSVLGAKFTTARRVAEIAADLIEDKLERSRSECRTSTTPLFGGDMPRLAEFTRETTERYRSVLDQPTIEHLIAAYGTETAALLTAAVNQPDGLRRIAPDRETVEAEITYAVEHEQARHLDDVVFRRTGLGTVGAFGDDALERCARLMAGPLGWTESELAREISATARRLVPPRPAGG